MKKANGARRWGDATIAVNKSIEEHLIRWIPSFCKKVMKETELLFYRAMAALTKQLLEFEKEHIGEKQGSEDPALVSP